MSCPTGVEMKVGVQKGSDWGTPVAAGAGDGVLILDDTLSKTAGRLIDDSRGLYNPTDSDKGKVECAGDMPMYARYDGIDLLIALALGDTGGAPTQQGATAAYTQVFTPVADRAGLFATVAKQIGGYVKEYPACKFNGFRLKFETGAAAELTFPLIADDEVNNSAVNTTVTMADVTYPETGNRLLFSQMVIRMNDQDGDALDSDDEITPVEGELIWDPKMRGVYDRTDDKNLISEPCNDGKPEYTLMLRFPKSDANTRFVDFQDDQALKLDIKFTGAIIEDAEAYEFNIEIPFAKISDPQAQTKEGIIDETVMFVLHEASAAPTGMSATAPFVIDVQNTQTADVLA